MVADSLRKQLVDIAAKMYARELISGLSGNLSARLADGNILVTPAGVSKSKLESEQLVIVDADGNILEASGDLQPTSELPLHLEVYRQRSDVGGVIHAHPVACIALSLVGISLEQPLLPEAVVMLGPVPFTKYATPSSTENRDAIAGLIGEHDAIILSQHGTLTVGHDLEEAFWRLETLEHTARTVALAYQLGEPRQLTKEAIEKLLGDK